MVDASDDTKSRLLDAAGRIFADKGFDSATIRDISQLASANIAAINYHFGDKQRLYIEAVREAHCSRSNLHPLPDFPVDWSPADKLRAFIRLFLARLLEEARPDWHLALMLRELAHPTDACVELVRDYIRPMAEVLRAILSDFLPATTPENERWLFGFSIVGQCLFYYVNQPIVRELVGAPMYESYSLDMIAEHIASFSLAALAHHPKLAEQGQTA